MTKSAQNSPSGKRTQKYSTQKEEANKLIESEKHKTAGHKRRFLIGQDNGKTGALLQLQKKKLTTNSNILGRINSSKNIKH